MKSGKTTQYYWLKTELAKHYSDLNFEKGVDLDRNGQIRGSERTDLNGDGKVDVSELKQFLRANRPALKNLGGFFKTFYSHGQALSPDNPFHDLLQIESEVVPPHLVKAAYHKVVQILNLVRRYSLQKMSPELKLRAVYKAMAAVGITLKGQDDCLFSHNINEGRGVLDCMTSGFGVLAVGHELAWPVYLVRAPSHRFIRWDDGIYVFNMDYGKNHSDQFYKMFFNIPSKSIENEVVLKNLGPDEILAQYLANRGHAKIELGDLRGAVADCTKAIKLDHNHSMAYSNRGVAKYELGNLEGAAADYTEAIKRDPNSSVAYYNRGIAQFILGRYTEAFEDFLKAEDLGSKG